MELIHQSKHQIWGIKEALNKIMTTSQKILKKVKEINSKSLDSNKSLLSEEIEVKNSIGRVLFQDFTSPINIPNSPTSMMDGYAVNSETVKEMMNLNTKSNSNKSIVLKVTKKVFADGDKKELLKEDTKSEICVYVTTGSPIPEGFDCVVPVEKVIKRENTIELLKEAMVQKDVFIRGIGKNISKGEVIVAKDTVLSELEIALIASIGVTKITVYKKARIALVSNGDEVNDPFAEANKDKLLTGGELFDSNKTIISLLIKKHFKDNIELIDLGINKDTMDDVKKSILKAHELGCNLMISTGGVSMGEHDYVKMFFEGLEDTSSNTVIKDKDNLKGSSQQKTDGQIVVGRVNMKPGLPTTFAYYDNLLFFGLSGNPVSCVVGYHMFAKQVIALVNRTLFGCLNEFPDYSVNSLVDTDSNPEKFSYEYKNIIDAQLLHQFQVASDRPELIRGKLYLCKNTFYCESSIDNQLSSTLKSLKAANCLIHIPSIQEHLKKSNNTTIQIGHKIEVFLIGEAYLINEQELQDISKRCNSEVNKKAFKGCSCCHHSTDVIKVNQENKESKGIVNSNENKTPSKNRIKVGLLVMSDKLLKQEYPDNRPLINLSEHLRSSTLQDTYELVNSSNSDNNSKSTNDLEILFKVIPNDKEKIKNAIDNIAKSGLVDVLLTSGGTGISDKDVTSITVKEIIRKECTGINHLITQESLKINPFACMSSPVCGVYEKLFIITCPGNPKAVIEIFDIVQPLLGHIVNQLNTKIDFH